MYSLEFTMNKVLFQIFGAMSKDSYVEICKYFGINKVEESIRHLQEKFLNRYSGSINRIMPKLSPCRHWHSSNCLNTKRFDAGLYLCCPLARRFVTRRFRQICLAFMLLSPQTHVSRRPSDCETDIHFI